MFFNKYIRSLNIIRFVVCLVHVSSTSGLGQQRIVLSYNLHVAGY